jgi:hypothetical protein
MLMSKPGNNPADIGGQLRFLFDSEDGGDMSGVQIEEDYKDRAWERWKIHKKYLSR